MDAGEEVSGGLVIAGRNRSVPLELTIEVLHEVARLVQFLVVETLNLSIALGRNDERFSCRKQRLDDALIGELSPKVGDGGNRKGGISWGA
jgi:hypothetical protein